MRLKYAALRQKFEFMLCANKIHYFSQFSHEITRFVTGRSCCLEDVKSLFFMVILFSFRVFMIIIITLNLNLHLYFDPN